MRAFFLFAIIALYQIASIQAEYTVIDPKDYDDNKEIQDCLNFGGQYIIEKAVDKDVIPKGDYEIKNITKIEENRLVNGADYRFYIDIVSEEGVNVNGNFTCYYKYKTGEMKVVSYHYDYHYPSDLKNEEGEEFCWENYEFENNEESPIVNEEWLNEEEVIVVIQPGGPIKIAPPASQ